MSDEPKNHGTNEATDPYADGWHAALRLAAGICKDRSEHFKRMANSPAATKADGLFAHEAQECMHAITREVGERVRKPEQRPSDAMPSLPEIVADIDAWLDTGGPVVRSHLESVSVRLHAVLRSADAPNLAPSTRMDRPQLTHAEPKTKGTNDDARAEDQPAHDYRSGGGAAAQPTAGSERRARPERDREAGERSAPAAAPEPGDRRGMATGIGGPSERDTFTVEELLCPRCRCPVGGDDHDNLGDGESVVCMTLAQRPVDTAATARRVFTPMDPRVQDLSSPCGVCSRPYGEHLVRPGVPGAHCPSTYAVPIIPIDPEAQRAVDEMVAKSTSALKTRPMSAIPGGTRVCKAGDVGEVAGPADYDREAVHVRWPNGEMSTHKALHLVTIPRRPTATAAGCGDPTCKGKDCGSVVCGLPLRAGAVGVPTSPRECAFCGALTEALSGFCSDSCAGEWENGGPRAEKTIPEDPLWKHTTDCLAKPEDRWQCPARGCVRSTYDAIRIATEVVAAAVAKAFEDGELAERQRRERDREECVMSEGAKRIARERQRQIKKLGWTPEHDDEHDDGSLAMAAACYAAPERIYVRKEFAAGESFVDPFPWHDADARPHNGNVLKEPTEAQRLRLLEKAGALIAAEIDRVLRERASPSSGDAPAEGAKEKP